MCQCRALPRLSFPPFWELELVVAAERGRISEELGFRRLSWVQGAV